MKYQNFTDLPGVGKAVSQDYKNLGFTHPDELLNEDPQELYERLCILQNTQVDRCMLYTFRCAHYAVNHPEVETKTLLWWNFVDNK
jgi:hypothetical protein